MLALLRIALGNQRDGFCTTMPVEINRWRATIGCFRLCTQRSCPRSKPFRPISILLRVFRLFWFCYCFIAVSTFVLPFALIMQFLAVHSMETQSCFLPLFARVHHFAKTVLYLTVELSKRIPVGVIGIVRYKRVALKQFLFLYSYFHIGCMTCDVLHTQWLVFRVILLSGDVEMNPGPETLNFCTWNLNSITAHDFLRVSLIEA